jgi:hypothetical protein
MYGVLTFSVGTPTRVEKNMSIAVKNHATTTPELDELCLNRRPLMAYKRRWVLNRTTASTMISGQVSCFPAATSFS